MDAVGKNDAQGYQQNPIPLDDGQFAAKQVYLIDGKEESKSEGCVGKVGKGIAEKTRGNE